MTRCWENGWSCPSCKAVRTDEVDPCLTLLPGVKFACCGHGGKGANYGYIYFENGVRLGVILTSIDYEDGRERLQFTKKDIARSVKREFGA